MADSKITALASIGTGTDPANDPLVIVDVSDILPGGMSLTGTTKKVTLNNLLACSPTATLASATITGAANFNGGALAGYLNGLLMFGSSGNTLNLFAQSSGFHIKNNSGTFPLLTLNNSGDFTVQDGAGGSRLTLNSTGLGVGTTVQYARLTVSGSNSTGIANIQNSAFASNALGTLSCYIGHDATANRPFIQAATGNAGNAFDLLIQPYGGNIGIGVTPSAGKGCLQLSSGINFPATQVASSDANTLDDYEEGTFTPTIEGQTSAGTGTYSIQVGSYTKVGRLVTVQVHLNWSAHTGTGNMLIAGLPFTSSGVGNLVGGVSIGYVDALALTAGNYLIAYVLNSNTRIQLVQTPTGGGSVALVPIDTAATIVFTATYTV